MESNRTNVEEITKTVEGLFMWAMFWYYWDVKFTLEIVLNGYCLVNNMEKTLQSKVVKEEVIYEGRFLGMKYVDYTIGDKTVQKYEKIFRTTTKSDKV